MNCESSLCPHPVPVSFSKISNFKYFGEPRPRRLDSIYTRKLSCHKSASLLEWYYMLIYWSNDYRYPACSINLRLTSCLPLQLLARVAAGCPQWPGSRLCTKGTEDRGRRGGSPRERVLRASNRQKTHTGSNNNKLLGSPEYITQRHQERPPIVRCTGRACWPMHIYLAHQVIRGPDALATLVAKHDMPAGGQQRGRGCIHAHRAERRPVILISGDTDAPIAGATAVGGTAYRCCNVSKTGHERRDFRLWLRWLGSRHRAPHRHVEWKVWPPDTDIDNGYAWACPL